MASRGRPDVEDLLAFRLHGPTASWGTVEAGVERRPSSRDPGRGAVLGLLAAALGLGRDDGEGQAALSDGVLIAVCGHGPRRLVQDFRTVQTVQALRGEDFPTRGHALALARNVHTLTGWRQHVEDGSWRVFVASAGADMASLADALQRPVFGLCLGRREHALALPPDPQLLKGGLAAALAAYAPEPGIAWMERGDLDLGVWLRDRVCGVGDGDAWWDPGFPGAPDGHGRYVVDQPVSRAQWRFRSREQRWGSAADIKAVLPRLPPASSFFDDGE